MGVHVFTVHVDLPEGTEYLRAEGIVAHAIAASLITGGIPGNVRVTNTHVKPGFKVGDIFDPATLDATVVRRT